MKTTFLKIGVFLMAGAFSLSSCDKEEEVVPEPDTYATIEGIAWANLNTTNGTNEFVPSGTVIIATANTKDYSSNIDNTVNYESVSYTTTVGTNGAYKFTDIVAFDEDVTVTLKFNEFTYNVIKVDPTDPLLTITEREIFTAGDINVIVVANSVQVQDVTYF